MTTSPYTFGADPELFVFDTKSEKFISSHELMPGSKSDPFPVEYGAIQVDGVAAEFNIDPSSTLKEFNRNIKAVRAQMLEIIQENGGKSLTLRASPTAHFDKKYFDALPQHTKELGCDPDFCGSTGKANPRPNAKDVTYRTGGGHIHIGWTSGVNPHEVSHFEDSCILARKLFDSGLCYDFLWDSDSERRNLYGSKYSFRPKSFGMEYRYLSNAWVDNDDAMEYVWDIARACIETLDAKAANKSLRKIIKTSSEMQKIFRDRNGYDIDKFVVSSNW